MRVRISLFASVLLAISPSCSSSGPAKGGDASAGNDVGQTKDVASDASAEAVVPPANVMFPDAPDVPCGGDAGECQLPPSACAAPSCDPNGCPGLQWVVYYDNAVCVGGKCVYTNRYFECSLQMMCSAGGCRFNGTAAP